MATDENKQPAHDSTGIGVWSRLTTEIFQSDFLAPMDVDLQDVQFTRRVSVYRLMLLLMLTSVGTIVIESLLFAPLTAPIIWVSLLGWSLLAATALWLHSHSRILVPPIFALGFNIGVVLWASAMGASHQTLWLFPLMVGLAGLLPTSVALIMGMAALCIFMWTEGLNREPQELAQTAALFATWVISLAVMRLMTHQADQLADLALSDPLTGAYNRRYMQPQAIRSLADYQRYARLSSLLMIDIDHFKSINDSFGHAEGDRVLKAIVSLIDNRIRGVDMLFRLGGEEFVILLSEAGALTAAKIAEELRISIANMKTTVGRPVTVSIGVCDVTLAESAEDWLTKVDEAMYAAKQQGRNRVYTLEPISIPNAKISSTLPIWR